MIRLALRCRAEQAETVLAELLEIAPSGVEEIAEPGVVEYAVYGAPGELPDVGLFEARIGDALVEVTTTEVPDDWDERWKRFYDTCAEVGTAPKGLDIRKAYSLEFINKGVGA